MLVESVNDPILLSEQEIIYEGLIDSIKSGVKYLKDKNEIRKYNNYLKSIGASKINLSDKDREELRKKSAEINGLKKRAKQFEDWFKFNKSSEGRNYFKFVNNKNMPKLDATSNAKFNNPYINTEVETTNQNKKEPKSNKSVPIKTNTKATAANNSKPTKKSKVPANKAPINKKASNRQMDNMPIPSQNPFV